VNSFSANEGAAGAITLLLPVMIGLLFPVVEEFGLSAPLLRCCMTGDLGCVAAGAGLGV
jgi:hypothetical protein